VLGGGPVRGVTGDNLDAGLAILNRKRPDIFPNATRDGYLITNACTNPLHRNKKVTDAGDKTIPGVLAVLTKPNIERLRDEIANVKVVIACGEEAHVAVKACKEFFGLVACVVNVNHTSNNGLGRPRSGCKDAAIERWVARVLRQLPEALT